MNILPPDDADKVVELKRFASEPIFDPWTEHPVPSFPLETLPTVVAEFVRSQSELIGCDPNGLAMASIAALGAALDHQFGLKIMRNGNWWVSPRMWVIICGDPSTKKSPMIDAATRELENAQGDVYDRWEKELAQHIAGGGTEEDGPARPPRYVISDVTTEKLGEILSRQGRGILAKRDELTGWIGSMEKYSSRGAGAADRAFWLQAFNGGRYTIDRIGRGEKRVANLSVSLIGGIQPARLAELRDLTSDGLLQRFVPVVVRESTFPVDASGAEAEGAFGRLVRQLLFLPPERIIMTDDALSTMRDLLLFVHTVEKASGGLASGFQSFAGKLQAVAGTLTLILHMASNPEHGSMTRVEASTVRAAERIVREFVLPHAFEFYRAAETVTDGDRLQKVASWILTSRKDRIVPSDLAANVAGYRGLGIGETNRQLSPLVAVGWLISEGSDPVARAWRVNPTVRRQLAERLRIEEERKAAIAELMNSPRRPRGGQ